MREAMHILKDLLKSDTTPHEDNKPGKASDENSIIKITKDDGTVEFYERIDPDTIEKNKE